MTGRTRGVIVVAVAVIQFTVPAAILATAEKPARFGWHMYSYGEPDFAVTATHVDGSTTEHDRAEWNIHRRDVHLTAELLRKLCAELPSAVRLTDRAGSLEVRCP
jgi:hypothetical protein